ncbi:Putative UDP-glucose 4-epimerase (Eurofung) [Aspergillus calidoustus]|uniref:Putative UDP-glucose 4-epimerase (Eurofung) n=1 Tax=Aspergillus calidoustus TaxID=454130 RepID=A0A0U5G3N1_ASPCI|nr:Putative UDP-glucose 4-epimerase (Eurofung) [Aspergillus calidoustus]
MGDHTSVKFLNLAAIIQEFNVDGQNIVQGFTKKEHYEAHNKPWFGATIGRVANRIKGGVISNLNGREYKLETNNGANALHGGSQGFGRLEFDGPTVVKRDGRTALKYTLLSPDGDQGYPGAVELRVYYVVSEVVEDGISRSILDIEYEAELVGGDVEETVVNITNHRYVFLSTFHDKDNANKQLRSYFNLSGSPSAAEGTIAKLATRDYLPLDNGIPLGPIEQHPIDTTQPFEFGPNTAFDDCFVIDRDQTDVKIDTRSRPLKLLAEFRHSESGINLQVSSTDPAFQFYTGAFIDVPEADAENPARGPFSGFCIEPSRYVNAINEPEWRHTVVLKKGEKYGSKVQYKGWRD